MAFDIRKISRRVKIPRQIKTAFFRRSSAGGRSLFSRVFLPKRLFPLLLAPLIWVTLSTLVSLYANRGFSPEIRQIVVGASVSVTPALKKEQAPPTLESSQNIRRPASVDVMNPALIRAETFVSSSPDVLRAAFSAPRFSPDSRAKTRLLVPVLAQDGVNAPILYGSQPYDDALDEEGRPWRWRLSDHLMAGYSPKKKVAKEPATIHKLPVYAKLPASRGRSGDYRALVENFSSRFNLSPDLVMAIIHSESDFSPTLVSSKSAMGLMQLLPSTASDEVHRFLYGRRGDVSYAELSVPETNIRYGTAYLHILLNRYFPEVQNRDVREHCVIAAYNMGPNRFLRLYGATPRLAVEKINSMSPEAFYADLYSRLPARETRYFVNKVRQMKRHYAKLPPS